MLVLGPWIETEGCKMGVGTCTGWMAGVFTKVVVGAMVDFINPGSCFKLLLGTTLGVV